MHVERRSVSARGPTSPMLLVYGFLTIILVGTLLLFLPWANTGEGFTPFLTALFTATSAVTVTGLVVVDTDVAWTPFGQAVTMVLFIVGGLGFMTGAAFLIVIVGQRIGLQSQLVIREGLGGGQLGAVTSLVRNIVIMALGIQVVGTLLLFAQWYVFGALWEGISAGSAMWHSLYHATSAFNNAGFDILPDETVGGASLIGFSSNYTVLLTMGLLIVLGGLGYSVLRDVVVIRRFARFRLDTKLVLIGSAGLVVLGAAVFLAEDWANPGTIGDRSVGGKAAEALFDSAAARTAGFTTIDYSATAPNRAITTEVLMFIGGASASAAGGIKINTFMVILIAVLANVRGRRRTTAFGREIPDLNVKRAMVVATVAAFTVVLFITLVVSVQPELPFRDAVFETVSAFGTVGLSTGITPDLNAAARIVLIVAMFVGRFGPLTFALLMTGREAREPFRLPEERVRIG